jgi:hypothetical protein
MSTADFRGLKIAHASSNGGLKRLLVVWPSSNPNTGIEGDPVSNIVPA